MAIRNPQLVLRSEALLRRAGSKIQDAFTLIELPAMSKGFTLIELLIVVTIIIALLAMLMPSLGHAVEVAQNAQCQSVQRQCAIANASFATDHFRYIDTRWGSGTHLGVGYTRYWAVDPQFVGRIGLRTEEVSNKWLDASQKKPEWGNGWRAGAIWPDKFDCPLERDRQWWLQKLYWGHEQGIGYNRGELNIWNNDYAPSMVSNPAGKIQFGDADGWWMQDWTADHRKYTGLGYVDHGGWSGLVPRHDIGAPGANLAFFDGHVDWLAIEQTFFYTTETGTTPDHPRNRKLWHLLY